jgi:hypothetical protein
MGRPRPQDNPIKTPETDDTDRRASILVYRGPSVSEGFSAEI